MATHTLTYGRHLPGCICCGRSSLARSDTASIAISHSPPPRSTLFRPPRLDIVGRLAKWRLKLVDTSQWRTPLVHGRSILARSDTASIAITHGPPQRSVLFRPPGEDIVSRLSTWRATLVDTSQWRTPPLRRDGLQYYRLNLLWRSVFI